MFEKSFSSHISLTSSDNEVDSGTKCQNNLHPINVCTEPSIANVDLNCGAEKSADFDEYIDEDDVAGADPFVSDLLRFIARRRPNQSLSTELLQIVRKHNPHLNLPLNAKTFLGMPRKALVIEMGLGKCCHFGLETGILDYLEHEYSGVGDAIQIQVSTVGFELFNNSYTHFWPLLGHVTASETVFMIGCYCGTSKPEDSNEFLRKLVENAVELMEKGL